MVVAADVARRRRAKYRSGATKKGDKYRADFEDVLARKPGGDSDAIDLGMQNAGRAPEEHLRLHMRKNTSWCDTFAGGSWVGAGDYQGAG